MATSASPAVITRFKELLATNADRTFDGISRSSEIDQLIGVGTAHQVFALIGTPQWVLRVRMSKAPTPPAHLALEPEASRRAAEHHLAPKVAMRSGDGLSICQRVLLNSPAWTDHADLMRAIHQLSTDGLRAAEHSLSLADHATYYWDQLTRDQQSNLGLSPLTPSIREDLALLDSSDRALCHNDLTPNNIGALEGHWVAMDWDYAAISSRYFDVAVASAHLSETVQNRFAWRVIGDGFCPDTWQTAKRITLLINHLWSLAELETLPPTLQRERLQVLWTR